MQRYILGRILQGLISILAIAFIVFMLARLSGDPLSFYLPDDCSPELRQTTARELGLDRPMIVQFGLYVAHAAQGDFGTSFKARRPALELVMEYFPATLQLGVVAVGFSLVVALPIGVLAAIKRGTFADLLARSFSILGQAMPSFWLGILLIMVFAVMLHWLPTSGRAGPLSYVLPAVTMGWYVSAGIMRIVRSSMLDVMDTEYIKLLRAKGLPEWQIIWKHALKNAAIPILTFSVILFIMMLSGSVVTETVFSWPGMGRLAIDSITWRDFPVIQAIVMILSVMFVMANLIVDLLYAYLNPKIRYQK